MNRYANSLRRQTIIVYVTIFIVLVAFKILYLDYAPTKVIPSPGFKVTLAVGINGQNTEANITSTLPMSNERQTIFDEIQDTQSFDFTINKVNGNRIGNWYLAKSNGEYDFNYTFHVKTRKVTYQLPDSLSHVLSTEQNMTAFLGASEKIPVAGLAVRNAVSNLGLNQNSDIVEVVGKVYHYISHEIRDVSNSEQTDVSSALMFGEANGITKNRMFVAMLRTLGVPSRLVGGLLLKPEETQRIHRWVEVYIGSHWVPFDPLQRKFAELPENYLTVYYGDYPFFRHNRNIDFKYSIGVERRLFLNTDLRAYPLNLMNAQPFFQKAGLPLDLLQIIITIPIGAVVIIIFRNVIGIQTFGTFLPVLIAATFRESGLFWGIIIFVLIILVGALLRSSLNGLRILHTPKLTILLVYVVLALLAVSALGVGFGNEDLGYTSLFPLALMALTIERFSLITEENGIKTALVLFANTVVTVIFCYVVITSILLQTIVLAYPEVLLLVVSVSIYLGAWKGLRITELIRFRKLIFRKEILS